MTRPGIAFIAALLLSAAASAAAGPDQAATLDRLLRLGEERPQAALDALANLPADSPLQQRQQQLARALVLAGHAREQEAREAADALRQQGAAGLVGAELVLASLSETQARPDLAESHARKARATLEQLCAQPGAAPDDCDARLRWLALTLQLRAAAGRGAAVEARRLAQAAADLARTAGDPYRLARSEGSLAVLDARAGDSSSAAAHLAAAKALARELGDAGLSGRLAQSEASLATLQGDQAWARRATEAGLATARAAGLTRLEAALLANLSDHELKAGQHAAALNAAARALAVVRGFGDLRAERTLLHNAGLAKIGLGRTAEGRRDVEVALAMWGRAGAQGEMSIALAEYGQALAAAGDVAGALELFHRERALVAEAVAANRAAAVVELDTRFQRAAQQREIELRSQDNAVQAAHLANQESMQRVWALLAVVAALAVVLIVLLLRRMRETQRELQSRQAALRVQSERDVLTGLSNRRHFQLAMQAQAAAAGGAGLEGALLLVDIDHFKHINDGHGHGVGDAVLVEVAQRLSAAVRDGDLVTRWGGEEFLVYAPGVSVDGANALAERVLHGIGGKDIHVGAKALRVTASIGFGRFPLPPHHVALGWEQALNLADMALYSAKSQGRNLALGIASAVAQDSAALREIEADFERAWQEGRATLTRLPGPAASAVPKLALAA